jgi:signal peptidase I
MDHPHGPTPKNDGLTKLGEHSPKETGSSDEPLGAVRSPAAALVAGPSDGLRRQLVSLVLWLLVALLLRWLVVEPRWIPSGSMLPTLQLQDRILVEKVSPRLGRTIKPGTVVVFHPPAQLVEAGYDPGAALIKRVVAGPGDQIEILGGRLLRNGQPVEPDWSAQSMDYRFGPVVVPPSHLLVLGDNRNASLDSHVWGPLPRDEVIGTAFWRYWPLQRFGPIRFSASAPPGGA